MSIKRLLKEFRGVITNDLISLYCDNQLAIHIAKNEVFYEKNKQIEVESHLIRTRVVGT